MIMDKKDEQLFHPPPPSTAMPYTEEILVKNMVVNSMRSRFSSTKFWQWNEKRVSLASGAMAGFSSRLLTHPLDLLKIRFQIQKQSLPLSNYKPKYKSIYQSLITIKNEEGYRGLYKGHLNAQLLAITSASIYFYCFENLKNSLNKKFSNQVPERSNLINSASGFLAAFSTLVCAYPIDTLRTRFCAQGCKIHYHDLTDALKKISSNEGIIGMYRGIIPAAINNAPCYAIFFYLYTGLKDFLSSNPFLPNCSDQTQYIASSFIASSSAGAISKGITYPLEVVQKQMQVEVFMKPKNINKKSIYQSLRFSLLKGGFRSLFKGYKVAVIRQSFMLAVSMSVYESMKKYLTSNYILNS